MGGRRQSAVSLYVNVETHQYVPSLRPGLSTTIWTNSFYNLDKYILQFYKYSLQFFQIDWETNRCLSMLMWKHLNLHVYFTIWTKVFENLDKYFLKLMCRHRPQQYVPRLGLSTTLTLHMLHHTQSHFNIWLKALWNCVIVQQCATVVQQRVQFKTWKSDTLGPILA